MFPRQTNQHLIYNWVLKQIYSFIYLQHVYQGSLILIFIDKITDSLREVLMNSILTYLNLFDNYFTKN